ncbi:uncharacterized protein LOC131256142 isoform X2 [Magnolia sinica]|uniref:uncharacterized protein LOC131256142 isoform X2 n=1 Tax=Magnolia sinica TaxID=86752 RepID=UPI002658749A|nr:uncharacterized protein LOC131256142 isoform X2 [Magnolia sinica]
MKMQIKLLPLLFLISCFLIGLIATLETVTMSNNKGFILSGEIAQGLTLSIIEFNGDAESRQWEFPRRKLQAHGGSGGGGAGGGKGAHGGGGGVITRPRNERRNGASTLLTSPISHTVMQVSVGWLLVFIFLF